jgi:hypothetical protein
MTTELCHLAVARQARTIEAKCTIPFLKGAAQLSASLSELTFDFLRHPRDWEHFSVTQRHLQISQGGTSAAKAARLRHGLCLGPSILPQAGSQDELKPRPTKILECLHRL